ncbi:MAG: tRNA (adenosine(37)-N6)-threonylcarbamoyltransferase complex ATPase subunit type 1 TsaE [Candidatus Magasanikbacteria bacterium]|nr:tRNA (adenosine(37)-N6)-threonylcarbamoyltransferase complex ATPase subunit type 1 TsaE [Candidatus Magasanikbacteria bacterium]
MKSEKHSIATEIAMLHFGESLASQCMGGDIILLKGDLGAGKTTLAKGIAKGLGVQDVITSPTFTYMQVYPVNTTQKGISQLVHIDTYRAEDVQTLRNIGIEEFLFDKKTLSLVEWPEKIYPLIKDTPYKEISIEHTKDNKRIVSITQN